MTETDRELLEFAAKAAGYGISSWDDMIDNCLYVSDPSTPSRRPFGWLPLTDDGDALRLACKLNMRLDLYTGVGAQSGPHPWAYQADYADKAAAARRAIVRAAAEIGRNME